MAEERTLTDEELDQENKEIMRRIIEKNRQWEMNFFPYMEEGELKDAKDRAFMQLINGASALLRAGIQPDGLRDFLKKRLKDLNLAATVEDVKRQMAVDYRLIEVKKCELEGVCR